MGCIVLMNSDKYLEERLDEQINWYDKKSTSCQKKFKTLRNLEIISSALLTFFAGLVTKNVFFPYLVGILGIIISIIAGILNLNKYQENWIEYRSICESLRHERYMFLTNAGVYNVENPFSILVERVEAIISNENVKWVKLNAPKKEEKNK